MVPNFNGGLGPVPIYTDVHGFRILPDEPDGVRSYDVILLGDSFAFGSLIRASESFAGLLKLRHPGLRIANAGVIAYGTDQELLTLRRCAPMLKDGGLLILLTYINDFDDIRHRGRDRPWFSLNGRALVFHPPAYWLNRLIWSSSAVRLTLDRLCTLMDCTEPLCCDDAYAARLYAALVEQMELVAQQRHAHFVVLYTSGKEANSATGKRWAAVARATAAAAGVKFLSLDANPGAARPDMYIAGDIHWNAAGHHFNYLYAATELDPLLHALLPLRRASADARAQD